jgi:serine/threonine-protein kinase
MATVYRARDLRLGREVAVKVIHRHLRENREVAARFASEALAVAKVKHPNIVEVYDVSESGDEERYLVVEFVRGKTLRQLLVERGQLPAEVAAAIGLEICAGLGHAHRQGVIHRDVKPENVLIQMDASGADSSASQHGLEPARVKITDFGIAKLLDAQGVTSTGQVLGSPAHMAPEQIEGGEVDARSDVFGVGVLLYECMVGVLPFSGQNPAQVLRRVLDGTFTPADRARPTVGSEWAAVLGKALAHHPVDRFTDTFELAAALRQVLTGLGFDEPRAELARYLTSPETYLADYQERVLTSLSRAGQSARDEGDVPRAASCFNRALAFKPDDTLLLAEVAGLARRARARRRAVRYGSTVLGVGAVLGLAGWLYQDERERRAEQKVAEQVGTVSSRPHTPPAPSSGSKSNDAASVAVEPDAREDEVTAAPSTERRQRPALVRPRKPVEPTGETREVRTLVAGPQNAKVRIDGQLEPWFKTHQLTPGPHTFEFVPPNTECCDATAPITVQIEAGQGIQVVRGTVPFKPAVLRHDGPPGSRASCGAAGQLVAGQVREIPMTSANLVLSCTVFPPPGGAEEPKRIDVTLQPGRTFAVTGS